MNIIGIIMIAGSLIARAGMAPAGQSGNIGETTKAGESRNIAETTKAGQSGNIGEMTKAAQRGKIGPTAENALEAERAVNQALLTSDADALGRLLADDWVVISAYGGVAERGPFITAIKSGQFTRKTMDLSDPRVKIYGNMAVVTTQLKTSGTIGGRDFDVLERQTDVLVWSDGAWKSVLLHETMIHK